MKNMFTLVLIGVVAVLVTGCGSVRNNLPVGPHHAWYPPNSLEPIMASSLPPQPRPCKERSFVGFGYNYHHSEGSDVYASKVVTECGTQIAVQVQTWNNTDVSYTPVQYQAPQVLSGYGGTILGGNGARVLGGYGASVGYSGAVAIPSGVAVCR